MAIKVSIPIMTADCASSVDPGQGVHIWPHEKLERLARLERLHLFEATKKSDHGWHARQ